jgi:serine/threonine-protein kinase
VGKRKFFWSRETETDSARAPQAPVSLADRIAAGPLPLAEALHYAIAMAEAVRVVHGRSRVYALLQPAGVKLLDDGVQFGPCVPAPISPYFSPEQVAGRELDTRSDIFSLGAVLYEMLSGHKAFDGVTKPALRFQILDREPPPLRNVPPAVSQLVMRCLEKKPEKRLQRMEILLAALKLQRIMATPMEAPRVSGENR